MKRSIAVAAMLFMMPVAAGAQDAIPALKGTWRGTGKILLFGSTEHLSGSPQNAVVRDLEVTHTVTGQDGRLIWGTTSSANNDSKEPFAWALSSDNKTIEGADSDVTESHSCGPTGSRNVTSKTPRDRGTPSLQPAS